MFKNRARYEEIIEELESHPDRYLPNASMSVSYMDSDTLGRFDELLNDTNCGERELQRFIESNKFILSCIPDCSAAGISYVFPQEKLGSEYVPDFLIASWRSSFFKWIAIELESHKHKIFTRNGDPTKELSHAIRQIQDWRTWVQSNIDYASRPRDKNGLGLIDITPRLKGIILIGRRSIDSAPTTQLRRQMSQDLNIELHTYDYLLDQMKSVKELNDQLWNKHG